MFSSDPRAGSRPRPSPTGRRARRSGSGPAPAGSGRRRPPAHRAAGRNWRRAGSAQEFFTSPITITELRGLVTGVTITCGLATLPRRARRIAAAASSGVRPATGTTPANGTLIAPSRSTRIRGSDGWPAPFCSAPIGVGPEICGAKPARRLEDRDRQDVADRDQVAGACVGRRRQEGQRLARIAPRSPASPGSRRRPRRSARSPRPRPGRSAAARAVLGQGASSRPGQPRAGRRRPQPARPRRRVADSRQAGSNEI